MKANASNNIINFISILSNILTYLDPRNGLIRNLVLIKGEPIVNQRIKKVTKKKAVVRAESLLLLYPVHVSGRPLSTRKIQRKRVYLMGFLFMRSIGKKEPWLCTSNFFIKKNKELLSCCEIL